MCSRILQGIIGQEPLQGRTPMQKTALYASSIIFAAGAVGQVARLIRGFEFVNDGIVVPM